MDISLQILIYVIGFLCMLCTIYLNYIFFILIHNRKNNFVEISNFNDDIDDEDIIFL